MESLYSKIQMEEKDKEGIKELQDKIKSLRESEDNTLKDLKVVNETLREGVRRGGRKYSIRTNRDRFFYPDEWGKFFDALKKQQKASFLFLINTGGRINECINVRVQDIDLANKRLVFRITKVKAKRGEKNPRPRIIPLSTEFTKWLKKYISDNKLNPEDYLGFKSKPATHTAMKKALQRAGIKDWYMFSTHNIRKTFETWLMALGVDGLKITAHMGHSMAVAAGHYVSADVFSWEEKNKMRMIIGDLYGR